MSYYAKSNIKHNGTTFEKGDVIDGLDEKEAKQLLESGSISTSPVEKEEVSTESVDEEETETEEEDQPQEDADKVNASDVPDANLRTGSEDQPNPNPANLAKPGPGEGAENAQVVPTPATDANPNPETDTTVPQGGASNQPGTLENTANSL